MKKTFLFISLLILAVSSGGYYFYNSNHNKLADALIRSYLDQKNFLKTTYKVNKFNRKNINISNIESYNIQKKLSVESIDVKYKETSILKQIISKESLQLDLDDYNLLANYLPDSLISKNVKYLFNNDDLLLIPLFKMSRLKGNSFHVDIYFKFTKSGQSSSGQLSLKITLNQKKLLITDISLKSNLHTKELEREFRINNFNLGGQLSFNIQKKSIEKVKIFNSDPLNIQIGDAKKKHFIGLDKIKIEGNSKKMNIILKKLIVDDNTYSNPLDSEATLQLSGKSLEIDGVVLLNSSRVKLLGYKYESNLLDNSHLELRLIAKKFGEEALDIKDIIPFCKKENIELTGEIDLSLYYPLGKSKSKGRLNSSFKDFSLKYSGLELSYLNTYIKLFNFDFMKSNKREMLKANRIQFGEKLENIEMSWYLEKNSLFLKNVTAEFLGGKLKLNSYRVNLNSSEFSPVALKFEKLDLHSFLSLGLKEGLTATGNLDGLLNISRNKNNVYIFEGRLNSLSRGVVKYKGKLKTGQEGSGTNILFRYLENLNYSQLKVDFKSDDNYDLKTQLNIVGKNLDFKELRGKPLDLKLNLDMNIMKGFQAYLLSVNLPKLIEKQISGILEKKNDK